MNNLKNLFLVFFLAFGSLVCAKSGDKLTEQCEEEVINDNYKKAAILCEKGCNAGYAEACRNAGYMHSEDESRANIFFKKARTIYEKECNAGKGFSCTRLAELQGEPNLKVKDLYEKACNLGDGIGCRRLGDFFYSGRIVKKDKKQAKKIFERGCSLGDKSSCNYVFTMSK